MSPFILVYRIFHLYFTMNLYDVMHRNVNWGFSTKHQRFEFHYKLNISNPVRSKGSVIFRNLNIINLVEILSARNDKTAIFYKISKLSVFYDGLQKLAAELFRNQVSLLFTNRDYLQREGKTPKPRGV